MEITVMEYSIEMYKKETEGTKEEDMRLSH